MDDFISYPTWVRVTKLQSLPEARHPHKIPDGYQVHGYALGGPVVGRRFNLVAHPSICLVLSTSPVREILSPFIFMTCNSFYLIEVADDVETEQLEDVAELVA